MVAHAWRLGIWPSRQRAAIDCVVRYASAACSVRLGLARTRRHRTMAARHDAAGESLEGMAKAPRWEQGEEQVWTSRESSTSVLMETAVAQRATTPRSEPRE